MAVRLRLRREGAKKDPHYRVVAADARSPRDGRFIEIIGDYHPRKQPSLIEIDEARALYWLRVGAQPTNQVENLLRISGIWDKFKPGQPPKRERSPKPLPEESPAQITGKGGLPGGSAAAPEEVAAEPGTPEDAAAAPVAESEEVRGQTEGAPGEGLEQGVTAPEQSPTTGKEPS
ncbi:MAG: 30S ribosomal protein S16 [Nitriliruptorales bacterium]